ncbi:MAG: SDR family oxidoreductase [Myxococcales bacterium]|nr:SDR family oxidoreductase [Myxococcales bacterium]
MSIFLTGATGYLGSYVAARLLDRSEQRLALLVRAKDEDGAARRLWESLQLHMDFDRFAELLQSRIDLFPGDLTRPRFGLETPAWQRLVATTDSVVHVAASLNRMSARLCFDVNLRGSLEVVELARAAHELHGVRRFSFVSTTAVCGERQDEVVQEDSSIDWGRRDYDPYGGTKKFAEHMVARLLPEVPVTIFRPSTVMGDTRFAATSQFDMVRATAMLARMKVIPLHPDGRHDIVPADYVGYAIADLHQRENLRHHIYHLSAGKGTETYRELMERIRLFGKVSRHVFAPALRGGFGAVAGAAAASPRALGISYAGALFKSFWPYLTFHTVFDNRRVVEELGAAPMPFGSYGSATLEFAIENDFRYPTRPWPEARASAKTPEVTPSAA